MLGMLTYGVELFHDNAHQPLAFEHCWNISNGNCLITLLYNRDLVLRDYHLFTYPKNSFGSQRFSNNEELGKVSKCT
jgi:hypothetical protein